MTWAHPLLLIGAPFGLFFGWWLFRRPARLDGGTRFANIHTFWAGPRGLSDTATIRRRARGVLFVLGTIGVLAAVARPQWGTVEETSFDQSREVLLALDLSRSMLAEDVVPTRLARAKLLSEALLEQLHGERVGLAVFAGTAFLQSPLSADYEVLRDFLKELDPSYLPQGGTNYDSLLGTAEKAFGETGDGDRYLVILSDGEAHDAQWKDHLESLKRRGIRVIALGVGTPEGAVLPDGKGGFVKDEQGAVVLSRLEPATLQELASATSGTYRDAATWVDIAELVNATVDQGRKGQYVEQHAVRLQERFQWFLAPALIALLLSFWIDFPVFPTPRTVPHSHSPRRTPAAAIAAALLCACLWTVPRHATALSTVPETPEQPAAGPATVAASPQQQLEATVAALSDQPMLAAPDYARLATDTVAYAGQPVTTPSDTRSAVIDDALAAVDRGEQLDAHATDWPALRHELERLKERAKQPPPQEPPPNQQQDSQNQDQQNHAGQQKSGQDNSGQGSADQQQDAHKTPAGEGQQQAQDQGGKGDEEQSEPQSGETQQQAGNSQQPQDGSKEQPLSGSGDSSSGGDREKPDAETASQSAAGADHKQDGTPDSGHAPQHDQQAYDPQKASAVPPGVPQPLEAADAALGDLEKPSPANAAREPQSDPPPTTRMIGGGRAVAGPPDQGNPVLAVAQGKMERIKEGDAPAVLFDRMNQADGAPAPANTGKNW